MHKCIMLDLCRTLWNGTRQPNEETVRTKEEAIERISELRKEWEIRVFEIEYANPIVISITEFDDEMNEVGDVDKVHVPLDYSTGYAILRVGEEFPDEIRKGHHHAGNVMMSVFGIDPLPCDD